MCLRLGYKFALRGNLHDSLNTLVESTYYKYCRKFHALSDESERRGIDNWRRAITTDVARIEAPPASRLDRIVARGIKDLKNMNIILKQSDKNMGIVAMHTHIYHRMVLDHLQDRHTYSKVNRFPFQDIIRRMRNVVHLSRASQRQRADWLSLAKSDAEPAHFYIMPKLHKKKLYTSRPIAAQHSYILTPLSKSLAKVLNKVVLNIKSIAWNTKIIAAELDQIKVSARCVFVAYDVVALYPNIDIADSLQVLSANVPVLNENSQFWLKVLQLILYNNYVQYGGEVYRQLQGTAMGTSVAPPFANLYLHFKLEQIFRTHANSTQFYRRFIDDGFVIMDSEEDGRRLMQDLNSCCNLRFTSEISTAGAIFLDFEIFKGRRYENEHRLDFRPYFKPTNKFLYLPALSYHPQHMKLSVVKGEAIRCLRNSTNKFEWLAAIHRVFKGLISRGFNGCDIQRQWKSVRWEERDFYLHGQGGKAKPPDGVIVLTRFHPHTKGVWRRLIAKHSLPRRLRPKRMRYNTKQREIVELWPPKIVFKDFKKLSRALISAKESEKSKQAQLPTPATGHTRS